MLLMHVFNVHILPATLDILTSYFPREPGTIPSPYVDHDAYHPAFEPLYAHYLAMVYGACGPFTHDPDELAYIAAARWPGFIQPVLDDHRQNLADFSAWLEAQRDAGVDEAELAEHAPPALAPPTEDTRLRLTRLFTPSLTAALEALHPRHTSAADWARTHAPPPDLLRLPPAQAASALRAGTADDEGRADEKDAAVLTRMAKFVLVAAFLASTNPPKSDVRMFGRGPDERRRRRRKGGGARKGRPGTATKVRLVSFARGVGSRAAHSGRSRSGSSGRSPSRSTGCSPSWACSWRRTTRRRGRPRPSTPCPANTRTSRSRGWPFTHRYARSLIFAGPGC